jgi:hypothetical protein
MKGLRGAAFLLVAVGLIVVLVARNKPAPDASTTRNAVVVELFTSEGCSSCPPADEVLTRLEKTQPVRNAEIIALSEHVDYWNQLGWSDPFSSPQFSARQNAYAQVIRGDGVYTPQIVVDGQVQFVGGNLNQAIDVIGRAARAPKAAVQLTALPPSSDGSRRLRIQADQLPRLSQGDTAEVVLVRERPAIQCRERRECRSQAESQRRRSAALVVGGARREWQVLCGTDSDFG